MTLGCVLGEIKANLHSRPSAATLQNYGPANRTGPDQGVNHAPLASGRRVGEVEEVSAPMRRVGSGGGAQAVQVISVTAFIFSYYDPQSREQDISCECSHVI